MISVEEAEQILTAIPVEPAIEEVSIHVALNRILAQDIESKIEMPPFDKSAMDGFAIASSDESEQFQIVEIIPAGTFPIQHLKKGECAKIMTGGVIPKGADRVIKKEVTIEKNGFMKLTGDDPNRNICFKGEDVRVGDVVLKRGVKIRAAELGLIASLGLEKLNLYRKPVVGILATGSELVDPGRPLSPGKIYDSNSYSLAAQVKEMGAIARSAGIVSDSKKNIKERIDELLISCDLVLLSGGVSMGDFDYVPSILKELGFFLHFQSVSIKPGKPSVFASRGMDVIFGVPGNPVSTFVIFEIFIKPLLFHMMGHKYVPNILPGILESGLSRKNAERSAFFPVCFNRGSVQPLSYHGSAHIHALTRANALAYMPKGEKELPSGSTVNVRSIS
ncbi:MAG: gephyrin-like molybdotransferase Glp [Anaerolineales bacterium]